MKKFKITHNTKELNAQAIDSGNGETCILFLLGGDVKLGKERYCEWQERLGAIGINSVSFDYSGVNGSGAPLEKSSLKSRIDEATFVTEWMIANMSAKKYILYGTSMGGYIALGLTAKMLDMFSKLILQVPAAYSSNAHTLPFNGQFTEEIRKEKSWEDSMSFKWLEEYKNPTLFIEAEHDEIIPKQITETYKTLKKGNKNFKSIVLSNATHNLWVDTPENTGYRNEIFNSITDFLK